MVVEYIHTPVWYIGTHHPLVRMWDMSICKHMASVRPILTFRIPFPSSARLGRIVYIYEPLSVYYKHVLKNSEYLFSIPRYSAISDYGKIAQIVVVASEKEAELETEGMGQ